MFSPLLPAWLAFVLALLVGALVVAAGLSSRLRWRWLTLCRRLALVVLVWLVMMNPQASGGVTTNAEALDVYVVVDSSISMTAEDWNGTEPRLAGVVADVEVLATLHAGARFSLITFDRTASRRLGLTRDTAALVSAAQTIKPPPEDYAAGTSIDAPLGLLIQVLEQSIENDPDRGRVVYYMGDGEQTASYDPATFAPLKDLVDGGAVLGYGTEVGATMPISRNWALSTTVDSARRRAVSKIDQAALQLIAKEAGLSYQQRLKPEGLGKVAFKGSFGREAGSQVQGTRSVAWLAGFGVVGLAGWEMAFQAGWIRRSRQLVHQAGEVAS